MLTEDESNELKVDEIIDLRGRVCPMTFVYTKLALEKMQPGQILKVILDYPPAFKNVPQSVTAQGLGEVIAKRKDGDAKAFWIKKAGS